MQNLGILLVAIVGILISHLLDEKTLYSWAWRLPYLINGILGGTVPLVCEWLMFKSQHIIACWALISLATSIFFISWENKTV